MEFDFTTYMRDQIAAKLKELKHTKSDPHFHRIAGLSDMEEFIGNQLLTEGYQLLIETRDDFRFIDNRSDNYLSRGYYSFYVAKNHAPGDFDAMEDAKKACTTVAGKIQSRMLRDYKEDAKKPVPQRTFGIGMLEPGSFSIRTVGPLGDHYTAAYVSFTMIDIPDIVYNSDDWTD